MNVNRGTGKQQKLPPGWRWARMGEVANVFAGSAAPQDPKYFGTSGQPFIRVSDIGGGRRIRNLTSSRDHLSPLAVSTLPLVKAKKGTILFPKSGAAISTNSRAIMGFDAYIVSHLMAISPGDNLISEWMFWWLSKIDMMSFSDNAAYPSLKRSVVEKINIPLPPLPEQKRIAAILNEQMAAVEKLRAAAEAQLEAAKALPAGYLRQMFPKEGQKLSPGWRWVTLGSVCDVVNGFGFPEHLQGRKDLPYPFIKVSDMNALGAEVVVSSAVNTVDKDILNSLRARIYPSRTIIFPKVGGALLTNKKRILGKDSCFDNNVMGLVPRDADADFLFCWFQTVDLRTLCNIQALPSIKQSRIAALRFPMPANAEQKRIAAILNEQMASAERLRNNLKKQLNEINSLPAVLLKRAFNGEF